MASVAITPPVHLNSFFLEIPPLQRFENNNNKEQVGASTNMQEQQHTMHNIIVEKRFP